MPATDSKRSSNNDPPRPEFAVTLGLLPPYTMEDVKRAYLTKVKDAHPDRGGSRDDFDRIQSAYAQAGEYLNFRSDRRLWIAARMEEYLVIESLTSEMRALGAEVETTMHDWVRRSFGDFADLTESIVAVRLVDSPSVDGLIDLLVREQTSLPGLKRINLAGCPVTDAMALELRVFNGLTHLDLSRTQITGKSLALIDWLPALREFEIEGTSVSWWSRTRLHRTLRSRNADRPNPALHPVNIR